MMTPKDVAKIIRQMVTPLKNRVLLTIGRGILLASKDDKFIQQLQVSLLADEVKDQVESMAHFGFTSRPPKGSDVVMVSVGANREHGIIIATEHREYRFKDLGEGEAALYSQDGDFVHLKNGNAIDVQTGTLNIQADTQVNITSPQVNITASAGVEMTTPEVKASAKVTASGDIESTTKVKAGTNVEAATAVLAPAMTASTSLIVAGQELNDYENHTHDYQDTGAPSNPSTTQSVN